MIVVKYANEMFACYVQHSCLSRRLFLFLSYNSLTHLREALSGVDLLVGQVLVCLDDNLTVRVHPAGHVSSSHVRGSGCVRVPLTGPCSHHTMAIGVVLRDHDCGLLL